MKAISPNEDLASVLANRSCYAYCRDGFELQQNEASGLEAVSDVPAIEPGRKKRVCVALPCLYNIPFGFEYIHNCDSFMSGISCKYPGVNVGVTSRGHKLYNIINDVLERMAEGQGQVELDDVPGPLSWAFPRMPQFINDSQEVELTFNASAYNLNYSQEAARVFFSADRSFSSVQAGEVFVSTVLDYFNASTTEEVCLGIRTAEAGDAQFSPPHRTIPDNAVAASRMSPFVVHTLRDDMYP
ncbi:hypothetical protein AK812_SmicGene28930 [Symbiodinium microadriaticum]|uniref:Uncharacterized protein n=1 Tax=Symbiodinium microadriaticum TaxID=2951 RepID=A0A1Q9D334_SYMMI|nr:hypothetical protein AK812_SmicGene28930 [Symbiodinium microadriaticum]